MSMIFAWRLYSFFLALPLGLDFDLAFGDFAALLDFDLAPEAAALDCRGFGDSAGAFAGRTASAAPSLGVFSTGAACEPRDRPRCRAVCCESSTRSWRNTSYG